MKKVLKTIINEIITFFNDFKNFIKKTKEIVIKNFVSTQLSKDFYKNNEPSLTDLILSSFLKENQNNDNISGQKCIQLYDEYTKKVREANINCGFSLILSIMFCVYGCLSLLKENFITFFLWIICGLFIFYIHMQMRKERNHYEIELNSARFHLMNINKINLYEIFLKNNFIQQKCKKQSI